ncbi:DUF983 domain-containing protein [Ferrovibrio sp.]|uniref:DUF983 domain-containing protein n=1 Tax=Ferrovibrio sp. TaxID=1917215 RepID=UPI000CC41041|nr:DUF983 domain-containing protein [Ferrovibrio sp.]PJI39135.1 MAG: hypothetical protein CTR53_14635 [Ferrovibrio sp.]
MAAAFYPPLSPVSTGLRCRCPRCGEAPLFDGLLTIKPRCPSCDLDYSRIDAGDGPAVFVILILGFVVVGLALWVELRFGPPLWLHLVLWTPLILGGAIGMLRPFKGVLIALQYRHKASSDIELLRE